MAIAVLPPTSGDLMQRASARTAVSDSRVRYRAPLTAVPRPRERVVRAPARTVPGRLTRRLTNLGVYALGALISAAIGPLLYAIGDRETAGRWILDVLALVASP